MKRQRNRVIISTTLAVAIVVYGVHLFVIGHPTNGVETASMTAVLAYLALNAVLVIWAGIYVSYRQRLQAAAEDPSERLSRRIKSVNAAFAEAVSLMHELQSDLEAQQAAREKLLAEAEHQQQLLELNREEAEKIGQLVTGETKATIRAERRRDWMFFTLGLVASIPIGILVNQIS